MNPFCCSPPNLCPEPTPEGRLDAEQPRLIIPACQHILESGRLCRCAASRGQRFCRHHIDLHARRLRAGRAERQIRLRFRMPLLEDLLAVQIAKARVLYTMDAGHIEPSIARQVLWALRLASGNIRFMEEQAQWELEQKSYVCRTAS